MPDTEIVDIPLSGINPDLQVAAQFGQLSRRLRLPFDFCPALVFFLT